MLAKQKQIIKDVKRIAKHHHELSEAKGELFNIYNILSLKTKEVRTHSAFIAELLNPKGTHFLGSVFLEAFIKLLPLEYFKDYIDAETCTVLVEYHTGPINNDLKIGGRIDILIKDGYNKTIVIENKIDAGDQLFQIERYYNYNKKNGNKVVYISKYGDSPDYNSKGDYIEGKDFHILSYQQDIINWLEECQSLASDQPILRESIKQYKILIQQITNTLGDKEDKELTTIIGENFEEAAIIVSKYNQLSNRLKKRFRDKVLEDLKSKLTDFHITNNNINNKHSHIWFHNTKPKMFEKVWFVIESFSGKGHKDSLLFIGIFDDKNNLSTQDYFLPVTKNWVHHQPLRYNNKEIRLNDVSFLKLLNDKDELIKITNSISAQILGFIKDYRSLLEK
ncbi:PD-(D/E)XK nuclease family protein [Psychroserpens sp. S379A]|uniref:PDDEXK-like family protein n=1 Tax=Psychroserpens sp. S379A TaxID=3415137 RepID=UPI003C7AD214